MIKFCNGLSKHSFSNHIAYFGGLKYPSMTLKPYSKRKLAAILLLTGLLLSFRGCYLRYCTNPPEEAPSKLKLLYDQLTPQQQTALLDILNDLSEQKRAKLEALMDSLPEAKLTALKDMLSQGLSAQGEGCETLKAMMAVLLEGNYSSSDVVQLVTDLQTSNFKSRKLKRYLKKVSKKLKTSPLQPSPTSKKGTKDMKPRVSKKPQSPGSTSIIPAWDKQLNQLALPQKAQKSLKKLLRGYDEQTQAEFHSLFGHADDDYQRKFLMAIVDLPDEKQKNAILKVVLYLNRNHKELAQKLCSKKLSGLEVATLGLIIFTSKEMSPQRDLLFKFQKKLL